MSHTIETIFTPQLKNKDLALEFKLDWDQLSTNFEEFPQVMCERFELVATFYDEGSCTKQVEIEIQDHLQDCTHCQQSLLEYRSMSQTFAQRRNIDVKISDKEVEQSFSRFMDLYGEELFVQQNLSDESSDERSDVPITDEETNIDRKTFLQVEGPKGKKAKTKVGIALGLVASAALLFAYGPALIETPIQETEFPVNAVTGVANNHLEQGIEQVDLDIPFSQNEGQFLPATQQSNKLTLVSLNAKQTQDEPLSVQYVLKDQQELINVDLTMIRLTQSQSETLKHRFKEVGQILSVSDKEGHQRSLQVRFQQLDTLQTAEYIIDQKHLQWAYSGENSKELLQRLIEAHLMQM